MLRLCLRASARSLISGLVFHTPKRGERGRSYDPALFAEQHNLNVRVAVVYLPRPKDYPRLGQ